MLLLLFCLFVCFFKIKQVASYFLTYNVHLLLKKIWGKLGCIPPGMQTKGMPLGPEIWWEVGEGQSSGSIKCHMLILGLHTLHAASDLICHSHCHMRTQHIQPEFRVRSGMWPQTWYMGSNPAHGSATNKQPQTKYVAPELVHKVRLSM